MEAIDVFEMRAASLGVGAREGQPAALRRLRVLPRLRREQEPALREQAASLSPDEQRAVIARELGFVGPEHARRVLSGEDADDYGALLYGEAQEVLGLNHWFSNYEEAQAVHARAGGYLLAYKRHFVIVSSAFIERLGLDPEDPDWTTLGKDWARRGAVQARRRLYGKLLAARAENSARG